MGLNFFSMANWTNNNVSFSSMVTAVDLSYMKISQKADLIFPPPEQALLESYFPLLLWQKTSFLGMPVLCICMCGPEASSSPSWMGSWDRETDNTSHFTRRLPNCSPLCTPVLQGGPRANEREKWAVQGNNHFAQGERRIKREKHLAQPQEMLY